MKVTPQGIARVHDRRESTEQSGAALALGPVGNTLWQVDDQNAIADGVAIDANDVWGAWTLQGARLGAYAIGGNGTPDFEFSSFGEGSSGVASAKGADRVAYMESNAAGNDFRIHGFKSTSDGTPDWSFSFPVRPIRICRPVPRGSPSRVTVRPSPPWSATNQPHRLQSSMSLRLTPARLDRHGLILFVWMLST